MSLLLNGGFAGFPNWHAPNQPICITVAYGQATTVPTGNRTLTCPDGSPAGTGGCGATNAQNRRWASTLDIAHDDPAGSYSADATYTPAGQPVCGNPDPTW